MRSDITPKLEIARTTLSVIENLLKKSDNDQEKLLKELTVLAGKLSAIIDCMTVNDRLLIGNQHIETSALLGEMRQKRDSLLDLVKREKN